jgi:hypothetical protein
MSGDTDESGPRTALGAGLIGGIDRSIGIIALVVVEHETGGALFGAPRRPVRTARLHPWSGHVP